MHVNGVPQPFASGCAITGRPSEPFAGAAREGLFAAGAGTDGLELPMGADQDQGRRPCPAEDKCPAP